ncbi:unnamed protein product, partial [Amoebophrya sp. A120]
RPPPLWVSRPARPASRGRPRAPLFFSYGFWGCLCARLLGRGPARRRLGGHPRAALGHAWVAETAIGFLFSDIGIVVAPSLLSVFVLLHSAACKFLLKMFGRVVRLRG